MSEWLVAGGARAGRLSAHDRPVQRGDSRDWLDAREVNCSKEILRGGREGGGKKRKSE